MNPKADLLLIFVLTIAGTGIAYMTVKWAETQPRSADTQTK